jgi:regulator of sigma E protease
MAVFYLVLGALMFIALVVVHEWGHFIAARRNGVEVEEFGIGFPPKIWSRKIKTKRSEFLFSLNLLPLGGFVKLKGESDSDKRKGSFGASSLKTKVKIMTAGVFMNLVTALILFTALAWIGMPKLVDNQFTVKSDTKLISEVKNPDTVLIEDIGKDSPAERAGLKVDDQIVSLAGQEIKRSQDAGKIAKENAGKEVPVTVKRGDQTIAYKVTLNAENKGDGYLGISSKSGAEGREVRRSTWSAPVVAVGLSAQFTELTFKGLGTVFSSLAKGDSQTAADQVSGPVGVAYILNEVSKIGFNFVLMVIAIISLTLAIMNILPIPALDGGRLFVTMLYRTLKRPLTKSKEELIHGTGFVVLMGLFVLITIVDIDRFIR